MSIEEYEKRYRFDKEWPLSEPSIKIMSTDLRLYRSERHMVPTTTNDTDKCIHDYKNWCVMYRLKLYNISSVTGNERYGENDSEGEEIFPADSDFFVDPHSAGKIEIRARAFSFRYPNSMAALIFSTGSNRSEDTYSHDGLLVLPNHNFVGEFSSEIGPDVEVFNTSDTRLGYSTLYLLEGENSPIGVLFEHLPPGRVFEPVTTSSPLSRDGKLVVPPRGSIKISVNYCDSQGNIGDAVNNGGLFYNSVGACVVPPGIVFDDVVNDGGTINAYNFTNEAREIILSEDIQGETVDNILGYVVSFPYYLKLYATKTTDVIKIDMNTVKFHMSYLLRTLNNVSIQPLSSLIVNITEITLRNYIPVPIENFGALETGREDESYVVHKYVRVVSLVPGIKVVTPVLDSPLYRKHAPVRIRIFNTTSNTVHLKTHVHTFGILVCNAAKILGNGSSP